MVAVAQVRYVPFCVFRLSDLLRMIPVVPLSGPDEVVLCLQGLARSTLGLPPSEALSSSM